MAARYALIPFWYYDSVDLTMKFVHQGAQRDSVTGQAFLETPASYWSSSPLVAGTQVNPKLFAHLAAYPNL
jgi:hypothetical protein